MFFGLTASAREDAIRLKDLLSEFQNLEENEVKTFFSTFVNSQVSRIKEFWRRRYEQPPISYYYSRNFKAA